MKITCLEKEVGQFLGEAFYKIPRFQRPYSWDHANLEEFWNDVVVENDADYFIGNFVVYDDKGVRAPEELVVRSITRPVATLVMVTRAPRSTAPEGSLTEPTMLPVPIVVWASSGQATINSHNTVQSVRVPRAHSDAGKRTAPCDGGTSSTEGHPRQA